MMRLLHNKVNIIPCIAKGDTLTLEEAHHFKQVVQAALKANEINTLGTHKLTAYKGGKLEAAKRLTKRMLVLSFIFSFIIFPPSQVPISGKR